MGSNIDVASTGALVNRLMNPPNMADQFAKGLDTLNAWKQFQANQAAADAYRQSVDPTTGAFDQGKFNALTSQGPGSWNFGAARCGRPVSDTARPADCQRRAHFRQRGAGPARPSAQHGPH